MDTLSDSDRFQFILWIFGIRNVSNQGKSIKFIQFKLIKTLKFEFLISPD